MNPATEQFVARHTDALLAGRGLGWLNDVRAGALARFAEHGLPRPRDENWKYTPIRPIEKQGFDLPAAEPGQLDGQRLEALGYPGLDSHRRVFHNGRHQGSLIGGGTLPEGVVCEPLATAFENHGDAIAPFLEREFTGSEQGFASLNTAYADDGLYLRVAAGVDVKIPLVLLFVGSSITRPAAIHPRLILHLEPNSSLVLIESYSGVDDHNNLTNVLSQIELEDGARLRHLRIQRESPKGFLINRTDVALASDAAYTGFAIDMGARLARHDLNVSLNGEGASCALNGLYVLGGRQHVDNHTRIDHAAGNTRSVEVYKGVLDGHSRGVFNGKVVVHEGSDGTDASQSNANLLLSSDAEIDTKPELEIYADDVKCSHGATIGQLDENALFYLRTRGMSYDEARGLLTYAFCREVVDRLKIDPVRERLASELLEHLPSGLIARELL